MTGTPNIDRVLASPDHQTGLFFTTVDVVRSTELTPAMRRIVFGGDGLGWFHMPGPNVAVRFFFPPDGERLELLTPSDEPPALVRRLRTRARVYTARRFDAETRELTVDFVIHEGGLASAWAARAQAGDRLLLSGPRAHAVPPDDASHVLCSADESALPALECLLAALPAEAVGAVFISVADLAEKRPVHAPADVVIEWVDRSGGATLVDALARWWADDPRRGAAPAAWIAGELHESRAVRDFLVDRAGYRRESIVSLPYWRRGSDATSLDEARAASVVRATEAGRDVGSVDDLDLVL